ncbi:C6 transcription factor [Colletotrichum chrysophilum]|uniref:C6 transcription factor n=1 Tax=Colletotrichum chrysophilum TaxID=1836956 RepID=A0AAD9AEA8_9PEZI|nr:C6 transcription factor [Colletotrichum chrysophilum]
MLFLNEARRQWELERGEALLTTAQALFIMYLTTLALGMETSATEYQLAACDMAHTLQSEVKGSLGTNDRDERAASKALWGMYCFESISAFSYLRPSALSKPPNFRHFFDGDTRHAAKLPDEECRVTMIRNAMVLEATCDLSATFNDIMEYNCGMVEYQMNIDDDFRIRRQFATLLSQLGSENHKLGSKEDSDLHGLYFRAYECQVAVAILRPLKPETPFPADDTVADLLFAQCERSIEGIEDHDRAYSVRYGSPMILHFLFNIAATLAGILRHLGSRNLFARTCRLIRDRTHYFPLAWQLLRGLSVIAMDSEDQIPEAAKLSFEGLLQLDESMSEDVPISFRVPSRRVSEGVRGHAEHGVRLSDLTSRMQSRKPAPGDGGGPA